MIGYRACLGLLFLGRRNTNARLEAACRRALEWGAVSYRSVNSLLATGLDRSPVEEGEIRIWTRGIAPALVIERSSVQSRLLVIPVVSLCAWGRVGL